MITLCQTMNNCPPKGRSRMVVGIYRDETKCQGIYLALGTDLTRDSCFSIYQNNARIKSTLYFQRNNAIWSFYLLFSLALPFILTFASKSTNIVLMLWVMGANQSLRKRISVALVNTIKKHFFYLPGPYSCICTLTN